MEQQEMIRIAKKAIEKRWAFETMKYGDDLYGKEKFADNENAWWQAGWTN